MKILINNKEQDAETIKTIQVDDYWVIVDKSLKPVFKEYYYKYENSKVHLHQDSIPKYHYLKAVKIIASTKRIDKSIPLIVFKEQSVEELANTANGYLFNNPKSLNPSGSKALAFDEGFKVGYTKAKSSDKKWNNEDMIHLFTWALENAPSATSHTKMISDKEYRNFVMNSLFNKYKALNEPKLPDVINLEMEDCGTLDAKCIGIRTVNSIDTFDIGYKLKTISTPEGDEIHITI